MAWMVFTSRPHRRAMEEHSPNFRLDQSFDSRIRMFGSWIIVAPIAHSRGPTIDLIDSPRVSSDPDVLRLEIAFIAKPEFEQIIPEAPVCTDKPQTRLPRMKVSVDQARYNYSIRRIDD